METEQPSLLVLTNSEFVLVDTDLLPELSQFKWHPSGRQGYAARSLGNREVELLHRRINRTPDGLPTDHINHFERDNRRANLRTVTQSRNIQNSRKCNPKRSSVFKGVSLRKDRNTWLAHICVSGKRIKVGTFKTEELAAQAYNEAALRYYGEGASLNNLNIQKAGP